MNKALIPIAAILSIAMIEAMALMKGINGTMLALSIGAIAGLGGYHIQKLIRRD